MDKKVVGGFNKSTDRLEACLRVLYVFFFFFNFFVPEDRRGVGKRGMPEMSEGRRNNFAQPVGPKGKKYSVRSNPSCEARQAT